jgi:hypothetical protein
MIVMKSASERLVICLLVVYTSERNKENKTSRKPFPHLRFK